MTNYEYPVYMNEVEVEMLLGLLAADSATDDGHEIYQHWNPIMEQLYRIMDN